MTPELDYRAIRQRVEDGVRRQKQVTRTVLFGVNVFIYALFMLIGWGIFLSSGGAAASAAAAAGQSDSPLVGAMVMTSMAGFMGLMFQFISLMMETKRGEDSLRERLAAREINLELLKLGMDDAAVMEKRKGMMRLTDDGELEAVVDDTALEDEAAGKKSAHE